MKMRSERGFTILELIAVVAVAGILAAVGIPAIRSYSHSAGLRAAAQQIAADFWYARQKAISTSVAHTVLFDAHDNSYTIFRDDGDGDPDDAANGVIDRDEEVRRTRFLNDRYELTEINLDPANAVIFVPRGTLKKGTTGGTITIAESESRARTVQVMASGLTRMN